MPENEFSIGYLMHWGGRLLRRIADQKLKPLGLAVAHLPVINALAKTEPLSQRALTKISAIEQPTMAATLSRMERDGIVQRRPDPNDKRSSLYSLTPATRKKLAAMERAIQDVNKEALRGLRPDQRAQFHEQLLRMVQAMERNLDGEA